MDRRQFLGSGLAAGLTAGFTSQVAAGNSAATDAHGAPLAALARSRRGEPFRLKYAPHFGMFEAHAGADLIDQLRFAHDEGFRAWEDNGLMWRDVETQERIGAALRELGMTMGVFVLDADFGSARYVNGDREARAALQQQCREALDVAKRVDAQWATVVPGRFEPGLEAGYQTASCIDTLKAMCEVCEPAGLVMVLEPLNAFVDHPGQFLTEISQAYLLCRAVGSPSCKILDDLYHQQISEGHLVRNFERAWDEIAYFQVGDNPGRCEPTTGEINYAHLFRRLADRDFRGVIGMEHGNSRAGREGERAVIDAYRAVDPV